jgi:hypothetical protein
MVAAVVAVGAVVCALFLKNTQPVAAPGEPVGVAGETAQRVH